MNDAIAVWDFAHRRNDAVADRPFKFEWIADDEDRFAFVGQFRRELTAPGAFERHLDVQQREITFLIHGNRAGHGKHFAFAVEGLDFSAGGPRTTCRLVTTWPGFQEETAAGHQSFAVGVVCRNGHDGGLYAFDELRKSFVGAGYGGEKKHQRKGEKTGVLSFMSLTPGQNEDFRPSKGFEGGGSRRLEKKKGPGWGPCRVRTY